MEMLGAGGGVGGAAGFFDDCLSLGCSALQTCGSGRRASAPALGTTDLKKRSVFVFCVCAAHKAWAQASSRLLK